MRHHIFIVLFIVLFQPQNLCASMININDADHALTNDEISKLKIIMYKEMGFYKDYMLLPNTMTYNVHIATEPLLKKYKMLRSNSISGIYSGQKDGAIIKTSNQFFRTTVHESSHFFVALGFNNLPVWINEGLAEYFETAYISNGQVYVQVHDDDRKILQQWDAEGQMPDLVSVLMWSGKSWYHMDDKSRKISWGLVYFLMSTQNGKNVLSKMIKNSKENRKAGTFLIIQADYKGGFSAFQKEFYTFLHHMPPLHKI